MNANQQHAHRVGPDHEARFEREHRMLAALTHPGIVRLLDGGLWGGRPYLVMELVDGEAITAYCDRRQSSITERLRLFEALCDAVKSAHRQLIVHLDLKPSNILVTVEGRIRVP